MPKMNKYELIEMMREEADKIYDELATLRSLIAQHAPGELARAEAYWLAHIDGALENRAGYMGGSFISFEDTISAIERDE